MQSAFWSKRCLLRGSDLEQDIRGDIHYNIRNPMPHCQVFSGINDTICHPFTALLYSDLHRVHWPILISDSAL